MARRSMTASSTASKKAARSRALMQAARRKATPVCATCGQATPWPCTTPEKVEMCFLRFQAGAPAGTEAEAETKPAGAGGTQGVAQ